MRLATIRTETDDGGSWIVLCEPCIRAESWLYDDVDAIDYDAPHGKCAYCERRADGAA